MGSNNGNIELERVQMRFPDGFTIDTWRDARQATNDYGIDRKLQKTGNFTGIGPQRTQDVMVNETQGGMSDRSKEHLGTTDMAIIAARRMLLRMARQLQEGTEPVSAAAGRPLPRPRHRRGHRGVDAGGGAGEARGHRRRDGVGGR